MIKIEQTLFIVIGFVFLGLGVLGIVLPVLPTTPLFCLTAACFLRGSEKFNARFKGTSFYIKYIEKSLKKKCMTKREKLRLLLGLFIVFTIAFCICQIRFIKIVITLVALGHLYYFGIYVKNEKAEGSKMIE